MTGRAFLISRLVLRDIRVTVTGIVAVLGFHAGVDNKLATVASGLTSGGLSDPVVNRDEQVLAVPGSSLPPPLWLVATLVGTLAAMVALTAIPARIGAMQPIVEALQSEAA
jgi:hypothetical protein